MNCISWTLELLCDGSAIVTLRRAGADPTRLTSALEKLIRYNRDHLGAAVNEDDYPATSDRRAFARRLIKWRRKSTHGQRREIGQLAQGRAFRFSHEVGQRPG